MTAIRNSDCSSCTMHVNSNVAHTLDVWRIVCTIDIGLVPLEMCLHHVVQAAEDAGLVQGSAQDMCLSPLGKGW